MEKVWESRMPLGTSGREAQSAERAEWHPTPHKVESVYSRCGLLDLGKSVGSHREVLL